MELQAKVTIKLTFIIANAFTFTRDLYFFKHFELL